RTEAGRAGRFTRGIRDDRLVGAPERAVAEPWLAGISFRHRHVARRRAGRQRRLRAEDGLHLDRRRDQCGVKDSGADHGTGMRAGDQRIDGDSGERSFRPRRCRAGFVEGPALRDQHLHRHGRETRAGQPGVACRPGGERSLV
ncbi:MAG: Adenylate cyclase, partial [uncultured Chthoniobacterales bacterium]